MTISPMMKSVIALILLFNVCLASFESNEGPQKITTPFLPQTKCVDTITFFSGKGFDSMVACLPENCDPEDRCPILIDGDEVIGYGIQKEGHKWEIHTPFSENVSVHGDRFLKEENQERHLMEHAALRKLFTTAGDSLLNWAGGVVPYVVSPGFDPIVLKHIEDAVVHWNSLVPVSIVPRTTQKFYVNIVPAPFACYSYVGDFGNIGGVAQELGLDPTGLCEFAATVHEFGHAIGAYHEQQRVDRDEYVTVQQQNINPDQFEANFPISDDSRTVGTPYDYSSIMHYGNSGFSINGGKTIIPDSTKIQEFLSNNPDAVVSPAEDDYIGQRFHLSEYDIIGHTAEYSVCTGNPESDSYTNELKWLVQSWTPYKVDRNICANVRSRVVSCVRDENEEQYRYEYEGSPIFRTGNACQPESQCMDDPSLAGTKPQNFESYKILHRGPGEVTSWNFDDTHPTNEIALLRDISPLIQGSAVNGGDTSKFDFVKSNSTTPSNQFNTGPSGDKSGSGYYIYAETSSYNNPYLDQSTRVDGEQASFETPMIDVNAVSSGECTLNFSHHFMGEITGSLAADVTLIGCGGSILTQQLWTMPLVSEDQWKTNSVVLPMGLNQDFTIRFTVIRGSSGFSDVAFDEIELSNCYIDTANTVSTIAPVTTSTSSTTSPTTTSTTTTPTAYFDPNEVSFDGALYKHVMVDNSNPEFIIAGIGVFADIQNNSYEVQLKFRDGAWIVVAPIDITSGGNLDEYFLFRSDDQSIKVYPIVGQFNVERDDQFLLSANMTVENGIVTASYSHVLMTNSSDLEEHNNIDWVTSNAVNLLFVNGFSLDTDLATENLPQAIFSSPYQVFDDVLPVVSRLTACVDADGDYDGSIPAISLDIQDSVKASTNVKNIFSEVEIDVTYVPAKFYRSGTPSSVYLFVEKAEAPSLACGFSLDFEEISSVGVFASKVSIPVDCLHYQEEVESRNGTLTAVLNFKRCRHFTSCNTYDPLAKHGIYFNPFNPSSLDNAPECLEYSVPLELQYDLTGFDEDKTVVVGPAKGKEEISQEVFGSFKGQAELKGEITHVYCNEISFGMCENFFDIGNQFGSIIQLPSDNSGEVTPINMVFRLDAEDTDLVGETNPLTVEVMDVWVLSSDASSFDSCDNTTCKDVTDDLFIQSQSYVDGVLPETPLSFGDVYLTFDVPVYPGSTTMDLSSLQCDKNLCDLVVNLKFKSESETRRVLFTSKSSGASVESLWGISKEHEMNEFESFSIQVSAKDTTLNAPEDAASSINHSGVFNILLAVLVMFIVVLQVISF